MSRCGPLDWHSAGCPFPGETRSGDQFLVKPSGKGGALLALVDGTGHGEEAWRAARAALAAIDVGTGSPAELIQRSHLALSGLRGAAVTVASIEGATLRWAAVGNVSGLLFRDGSGIGVQSVLSGAGVVGHELPRLVEQTVKLLPGDTLVFTTDGIDPAYADDFRALGPPHLLAELIFDRHHKGTDDALVLVARYGHLEAP